MHIDFQTSPAAYRHWRLDINSDIATLTMDVDENGSLFDGCLLKLNSYDLGVDIELFDAITRLRFEHPQVRCVILQSGQERVFCAGANIKMLNVASHQHKVNFCKFTNETRNAIEDASANSGQRYLCAVGGTAAGGGYELALACDLRIVSETTRLTTAFARVGLSGDFGGSYFLTQLVGSAKAREMYFLSETVDAEQARALNLVTKVVSDASLEAETTEIATRLANGPAITLGYMKQNINAAESGSLAEVFDLEAAHHAATSLTEDHREAARAFVEKRPPVYKGR
ncbi:MAG: enoyl-CoA hydratase/isomerase family protein [Rhodobacteraceae bacterium]|nr:enoyl-CoA hydratase/isomerase family protein [Paracoccaceae bacterium]